MTTHRQIVDALASASTANESVVLATVVRVTGSSYGGVGARMLVRVDGSTVGLVSGGCVESDLAEHARRVHDAGHAEVVSYDTRDDEDAPWGLGLGCNGLIEILLEPLPPPRAGYLAKMLDRALRADAPSVIATVIHIARVMDSSLSIGAHALFTGNRIEKSGEWGSAAMLVDVAADVPDALTAGRRGLVRDHDGVDVAFEVVMPAIQLVICGSGPDVVPIARFASALGWNVSVIDHRPVAEERSARFPGARLVECAEAARLADATTITSRTAAVVMSHHFTRDTDYVQALLATRAAYIGVLGPRARTERMLTDLAARGVSTESTGDRFFSPVGMDIGGDGPDAIALAIIAEISAVAGGRAGGHLRDKRGPLHAAGSETPRV